MKALVIKFRNIGDVLLTTPLLRNLKLNYPESTIDVVVNRNTKEMLTLNPDINKIFTYDRETIQHFSLPKRVLAEYEFYRQFKNDYDIVINTTEGDRGAFIAFFSKAKTKIGYPVKKNRLLKNLFTYRLPKQGAKHIIEANLDALRVLDLPIFEKKVKIYWSRENEDKIKDIVAYHKFVHIHPVSRWLFKCIEDKITAEIIDFIKRELNLEVVITSGPDKKELIKIANILRLTKSDPVNLSGKLSLKEVAALNKRARLFIGVDTAIMHISAANNIPTLAFFGPSGAFNWGPWDNDLMESGYKKHNGIQQMGKHRVIQENWECVPCGKDGCNGSKISNCLKRFNMDSIKRSIMEMLND